VAGVYSHEPAVTLRYDVEIINVKMDENGEIVCPNWRAMLFGRGSFESRSTFEQNHHRNAGAVASKTGNDTLQIWNIYLPHRKREDRLPKLACYAFWSSFLVEEVSNRGVLLSKTSTEMQEPWLRKPETYGRGVKKAAVACCELDQWLREKRIRTAGCACRRGRRKRVCWTPWRSDGRPSCSRRRGLA